MGKRGRAYQFQKEFKASYQFTSHWGLRLLHLNALKYVFGRAQFLLLLERSGARTETESKIFRSEGTALVVDGDKVVKCAELRIGHVKLLSQ